MATQYLFPRVEECELLDEAGKLADIAGPGVVEQAFERFRRQADLLLPFFGKALDEVGGQQGDIFATIAQGGGWSD